MNRLPYFPAGSTDTHPLMRKEGGCETFCTLCRKNLSNLLASEPRSSVA